MAHDIQERSFQFACRVISLYERLQRKSGTGRVLSRQLIRSATSIGANLVEASGGQSRADFISKCSIAAKEARETYYWLRLLSAADVRPTEELAPLLAEANELVAILTAIVVNSKAREVRQ